ncbi:hypothetical protein [Cryobacterium arcticum]|uniref:hypothetical protein n=1 Tax=Cryobacterium arcticum TaxID=670052 RepID=UPI0011B676C6|nr:hypothetical protein [Cryobacterium arcticum]
MKDVVRVLFDTRETNWKDNPYIDLLAQSVRPDIVIVGFTWRVLLTGKYDAFHVHWPEHLITQPTFARRLVVRTLFFLALVRLRCKRVPVVRTMHNRNAHFQVERIDKALLQLFERLVTARIWLSDREDEDGVRGDGDVVIPHSDYAPWLEALGTLEEAPLGINQILCFGVIRRYKRFDEVANAAVNLGYPHLTIAGAPSEPDYAKELRSIAEAHPSRLSIILKRLDSEELVERIQSANLVVVPYADLYNSGVVLLALSLQRPVALRESSASRALAAEYGDYWIRRYEGELTALSLDRLIAEPDDVQARAFSERRQWSFAAREHRAVYRRVTRRPH